MRGFLAFSSSAAEESAPAVGGGGLCCLSTLPTTLTRNEIRERAARFAAEWRAEHRERAEKDTFWNEFLEVFGIARRRVAVFERRASRISTGGRGFIDLFWPGYLIAEHKSRGADLAAALDSQALDYLGDIPANQFPRLVVVSDFARFRLLDLDPETNERGDEVEFAIDDLPRQIDRFMFLAGYEEQSFREQDAVNIDAAELLGAVYEELEETGYAGHDLRALIVRLLFLLFADDTGLWRRNQFQEYLRNRTEEDGRDLGMHISRLFDVLNTPDNARSNALDEDLSAFPYVNGGLFRERIATADCTRAVRERLLEACEFNWSGISPAIFGSIFQSVMDADERRQLGAHYTTERNIRRLLEPMFLEDLRAELEACGTSAQKLRNLHSRIAAIRCLDPAMGCGNFLIIAYQELRRIETQLLLRLYPRSVQMTLDLGAWRKVTVGQFYGIEIEEFPARIAETAMYLVDHLENEALGKAFGINIVDLPLKDTAHVRIGNALRLDWNEVLPAAECTYLFGNPPFAGQTTRNADQTSDLRHVWGGQYARWLDYVSGWYAKARDYLVLSPGRAAFVSTNSVTQGEQTARTWRSLVEAGIEIDFAHRTFNWSSEARGRAHVHCVIIGFSPGGRAKRRVLFEYEDINGEPTARVVPKINPYLVPAETVLVEARTRPLSRDLPTVDYGNKPSDGGHLIVEDAEQPTDDPIAMKYLRRYVGARELLHNEPRWCLWLVDAAPGEITGSRFLRERVARVRAFREASSAADTRKYANLPYRFFRIPQPDANYIAIPRHVSETRRWFTVDHFPPSVIASDALFTAVDPDGFLFGVLSSMMFITWMRTVGGAIKSDLRFSGSVVYNTFPMRPPDPKSREAIVSAGAEVLAARRQHAGACLAELYAPDAMPGPLVSAHEKLDRTVDRMFRPRGHFTSESDRLTALFQLYSELTTGELLPGTAQTSGGRSPRRTR